MKGDKTPTFIGGEIEKLILVGVQSPSKIKPPADGRGVLDLEDETFSELEEIYHLR